MADDDGDQVDKAARPPKKQPPENDPNNPKGKNPSSPLPGQASNYQRVTGSSGPTNMIVTSPVPGAGSPQAVVSHALPGGLTSRNPPSTPGDPNNPDELEMLTEIGVTGLKDSRGVIIEEFLPQLSGHRAVRIYREMRDNDPIIGALMFAIVNMLRPARWTAEPADISDKAKAEADFVESLLDDMEHPFGDFVSEALTMLEFGWQMTEMVFKNRTGADEKDPSKKSKYEDGRIGIRKLAPRAQDTLWRWEMTQDGTLLGMWQLPPLPVPGKPMLIFLPIERCILFRTTSRKSNPEGVSVLRNAYRSWWYTTRIEEFEAIGIERELAGAPVIRIPSRYLRPNATTRERQVAENYRAIARDFRRNEQGGLVIPSDPYYDADGKPLPNAFQVDVNLISAAGSRQIDCDKVITRHQTNIARSVLADFIMLGSSGRGAYALSKNKTDLFLKACETFLNILADALNRHLLPAIWEANNLDHELMPKLKPGRIAPVDLVELAAFLKDFAGAGAELFPDVDLENYIREMADIPQKSEEAIKAQNAAAAALAAQKQPPGFGAKPGQTGAPPNAPKPQQAMPEKPQTGGANGKGQVSNDTAQPEPEAFFGGPADSGGVKKTLGPGATVADYIHDFVHSDNKRFAGKSKEERIQMALGAAYAAGALEKMLSGVDLDVEKFNPYHEPGGSPEGGRFASGGSYGLVPGDAAKFREMKANWARVNNSLLRYVDKPDSPEAQDKVRQLEQITQAMHGLHADPGTPEGIGLPGSPRDVTIVGAGPGGLAAGIMGGAEGLDTQIVEANAVPGGQAKFSSRIENFPGFPVGVTGEKLTNDMFAQANRLGAETTLGTRVTGMTYDPETGMKHLTLSDGSTIDTRSVILAGGVEFRKDNFPGADGPGVIVGDGKTLAEKSAGGTSLVIGGSNGAAQAALGAAANADHVYLMSRSPLEKNMSDYQIQAVRNNPKISVIENDKIARLNRNASGDPESIDTVGGKRLNVKAVGLFLGSMPDTKWVPESVGRDRSGRVATNASLETNIPGVFAVGDMRQGAIGRIGVAVGEGQLALRQANEYLSTLRQKAPVPPVTTIKAAVDSLTSRLITRAFDLDIANPWFGQTVEPEEDGVYKFNDVHDERGRFATSWSGAMGRTFASPNVGHRDITSAIKELQGARHVAVSNAMAEVDHQMGIQSRTPQNVVGAWKDGAENSVMTRHSGMTDPQDLRSAAAMKGWLGNQKSVLIFQPGGANDHFLAQFHATGDLQQLHQHLLDAGVSDHTLEPTGRGVDVHVFGDNQNTLDAVSNVAGQHGAHVSVQYGHGDLIGNVSNEGSTDAEQRAIARRAYEQEIQNAAQRDGGKALRAWGRIRATYGSSLDAIKRGLNGDGQAVGYRACIGIDFAKAVGSVLCSSRPSPVVTDPDIALSALDKSDDHPCLIKIAMDEQTPVIEAGARLRIDGYDPSGEVPTAYATLLG